MRGMAADCSRDSPITGIMDELLSKGRRQKHILPHKTSFEIQPSFTVLFQNSSLHQYAVIEH